MYYLCLSVHTEDEAVGMMITNEDDEVRVVSGRFYVFIAYLLRRRGIVWAMEEVGFFEIEREKFGKLPRVFTSSFFVSLYRLAYLL